MSFGRCILKRLKIVAVVNRGNEFGSETPQNPSVVPSKEDPLVMERRTKVHTDYDYFLTRTLDNAVILSYRRYDSGQQVFDELLAHFNGDLPATMEFIRSLPWTKSDPPPMTYLENSLKTLP